MGLLAIWIGLSIGAFLAEAFIKTGNFEHAIKASVSYGVAILAVHFMGAA